MYYAIIVALVALGGWLARLGHLRGRPGWTAAGAAVLLATLGFFALLDFWGEVLWFQALGYEDRLWTTLGAQVAGALAGAATAALAVHLLTAPARAARGELGGWPAIAGALLGAYWGAGTWDEALLYFSRISTALHEPILGLSTGFYLFVLPFLERLAGLAGWVALVVGAAALFASFASFRIGPRGMPAPGPHFSLRPLLWASAALAAVLALQQVLAVFRLLHSEWGVVYGPGWTDAHVRMPAHLVVAALTLALGCAPLVPALRRKLARPWFRPREAVPLAATWATVAGVWLVGLGLIPAAFQWLLVEPNELTYERPYIAHNIRFTRYGYGLDKVEVRQFPANRELTRDKLRDNRHLLSEVRLWDWRALDAVYAQFQEIRLYYEFHDVDVDRYTVDGRYRQFMVSARELDQSNLPPDSRTFVNRRFKYTHGYGITVASVNDFTPDGLPNLLVKDIPPRAAADSLAVERPQIYYGELTREPVVVNSREAEFDYPRGEENAYIRYPGTGGVALSSLWRKFLFGWKFDGTRFFLSSYPTAESRVMFHRQVRERVARLAPFLQLDEDPYVVLADGRLFWIVDAYTTSADYPYSAPMTGREMAQYQPSLENVRYLHRANYVRNSVKAVVDAFEGSVDFYVFEPEDPLIQAWRSVFPGLFKDRHHMPPALRDHVRYPVGMLLAQGLVYAKYHMTDPEVFYNQEDLWVRATEKHYASLEPVAPYYVMWRPPGAERAEFTLIMPFTPKNRQVLIGWIAGLCDGDNYGRFIAYKFPKEVRVLGPQQVETKIDQHRVLSGQLTLWDQRGSNVIRGNVLAIPIDDTLVYFEPIYLEAETAAYPELRLVVAMHGDRLSYGETFSEALDGLVGEAPPGPARPVAEAAELAQRAERAFNAYLQLQAEGRFVEAARELETLSELLGRWRTELR